MASENFKIEVCFNPFTENFKITANFFGSGVLNALIKANFIRLTRSRMVRQNENFMTIANFIPGYASNFAISVVFGGYRAILNFIGRVRQPKEEEKNYEEDTSIKVIIGERRYE